MCLQGRMPLHKAIAAGQLHMVRYCLSKQNLPELDGQNSVSMPSKVFISCLEAACSNNVTRLPMW